MSVVPVHTREVVVVINLNEQLDSQAMAIRKAVYDSEITTITPILIKNMTYMLESLLGEVRKPFQFVLRDAGFSVSNQEAIWNSVILAAWNEVCEIAWPDVRVVVRSAQ